MLYKHNKSGKVYSVDCTVMLKEDGIWKESVLYSEVGKDKKFVRLVSDFYDKFTICESE